MRERGSALLVAIVSVMILLLISGVFFSLVTDQIKSNSYEERAIKSYYLAQAGLFYGVAKIRADIVPVSDSTGKSTQAPVLNPFGYVGQYYVEWQKSADGLYYTITSKGSYGSGTTGKVDRTLQAYYKIGTGGSGGEVPEDFISQAILNFDDKGNAILGQGNTLFVFSNAYPLVMSDGKLPVVQFNQPVYIYTVLDNGSGKVIDGQSKATSVRLSLRNGKDETIEGRFYDIPDFQGVSGINPDSTGTPTPVSITYTGNEVVHLVVEGSITRGVGSDPSKYETGTVANYYLISSDDGLIWQIEN